MRQRTWRDNADEFKELDQGEGWPFARLVACSVVNGGHGGARRGSSLDRDLNGKVNATEFARRADTSNDRVLRYLAGWERAVEKGWVPSADTLTPDSVVGMTDPEHNWKEVYDASKSGGRPRDSRPEDAATIVSRRGAAAVVEALTEEQQEEVATAIAERRDAMETERRRREGEEAGRSASFMETANVLIAMANSGERAMASIRGDLDAKLASLSEEERGVLTQEKARITTILDRFEFALIVSQS